MIARVVIVLMLLSLWTPLEDHEFFVEDGEARCLVVYGENSADFESARIIAEKIAEISRAKEETVPYIEENYVTENDYRTTHCDFIVVGNTTGYFDRKPYTALPLWYDDKNLNGELDKDESREEIFINFSEEDGRFPVVRIGGFRYRTVIEELPIKKSWRSGEKTVYLYEGSRKVRFLNQDLSPLDFFQSVGENVLLLGDPYQTTVPLQEHIEFQDWTISLGEEYLVTEPNGNTHRFDPADLISVKRNICSLGEATIFAMRIENGDAALYVLRNYDAVRSATGIEIGGTEWNLSVRSGDIEYEDVNDMSPAFKDDTTEYLIELKNYSQHEEKVFLSAFQVPPCGLSEGRYTGRIFFTLEITDPDSSDETVERVTLTYKKIIQESFLKYMLKDTELTDQIRSSYNIISVGGPGLTAMESGTHTCNTWTKSLVDTELSTVDWYSSEGEWEYLEEKRTLIVAGKDREATREAAEKLVETL